VTRDRAVRGAIALADVGGVESLSMRKVAAGLGIEAMSLYYHVKNKSDLLDGMLDAVYAEFATPAAGDDWREAMKARATSTRNVLNRHPWALGIEARTTPGPATLAHIDSTIGCLLAAGFGMPMIGHAMSILDSYVHGFAQQEAALPLDQSGDIGAATEDIIAQQQSMADTFPHLAAMASELVLQPGYAYANEFEFGLTVVLDGIAAAHAAER
jgi:AcrR family transcriptional regulator